MGKRYFSEEEIAEAEQALIAVEEVQKFVNYTLILSMKHERAPQKEHKMEMKK